MSADRLASPATFQHARTPAAGVTICTSRSLYAGSPSYHSRRTSDIHAVSLFPRDHLGITPNFHASFIAMHMDMDVLENDDKEIEIGDKEWL